MQFFAVWKPLFYALARRIAAVAVSGLLAVSATDWIHFTKDAVKVDPTTAKLWAVLWIIIEALQKGYRLWREA